MLLRWRNCRIVQFRDARIGHGHTAIGAAACDRARGLIPAADVVAREDLVPLLALGHHAPEVAPVPARRNAREPEPVDPRQARQAMERSGLGRLGQRQHAEDLAAPAHALQRRAIHVGRHRLGTPRDEQVAPPVLRQPAHLAAVVHLLVQVVPVRVQELARLDEQRGAAGLNAGHVLQHQQRRGLIPCGAEHEQAARHEAVEPLVFLALRRGLGEQPREALARRRQKHRVRPALAPRRAQLGRLQRVHVSTQRGRAGEPLEIAAGITVDVHAADRPEARGGAAEVRGRVEEAARAGPEAAEQEAGGESAHHHPTPSACCPRSDWPRKPRHNPSRNRSWRRAP